MPRLGLGLGLNLPRPIWFGGGSPSLPTAGNVGYYSADDINTLGFSSANAVNWWQDQGIAGSSNDLTQGTASANMTFIEHDTVTQFTLARQPTLVDLGGGELVSRFNADIINGDVITSSTKKTIKARLTYNLDGRNIFMRDTISGRDNWQMQSASFMQWEMDINSYRGITLLSPMVVGTTYDIVFTMDFDLLKINLWVDDIYQGEDDIIAGSTWNLANKIGHTSVSQFDLFEYSYYDVVVADPTNITETPTFQLLPTEESCNTTTGGLISRWNSTTHKPWLNRLLSDGNDDHLEGVAVQTGDFTYMFKLSFNALSTTEYIFSHTAGLSAVVLLSDNYIYLRDTTGANDIALTGHTVELGEHVYTITREGNSLKYYVDSCLKDTIDVTGRTFELDTFGRPTDSLADLTAEWGVWDRALTKEELDYFSYLRSEDTNEILLPPLTPDCP